VDLKTGILRDGRPEDLISRVTAVTPADAADCPCFLAFLTYALNNNAENIGFFLRYFGYGLTGLTDEEMLLVMWGLPGAGKGTAVKTIRAIMGDYAGVLPVSMFGARQSDKLEYYRARLVGLRLVLASEPEKDAQWSEAFVNEITGSDPVHARHPGGRPFDFDPTHKLAINGNNIPNLKGFGTGIKRRLAILPFERPPERPNKKLKTELRAEYPGILRLMIDGCLAWQDRGLDPPPDVKAAVAEYFARQNVVARWLEECCDLLHTASSRPSELRASYNAWAQKNAEKPMGTVDFHDVIENLGKADPTIRQVTINGYGYVRGIAIKPHLEGR
jgi:putative DNA primase/helicase